MRLKIKYLNVSSGKRTPWMFWNYFTSVTERKLGPIPAVLSIIGAFVT